MNIRRSTDRYETWLNKQLKGGLVAGAIDLKHQRMCEGPLEFMRATYWRWAERVLDRKVCGKLADAPVVLAVGDIHIENFGTWRDREGRLVWGVNDFDEAARMPYLLDLVRLATSATLAAEGRIPLPAIAERLLDGYRKGLGDPKPIILDHQEGWLFSLLKLSPKARRHFWEEFDPPAPPDEPAAEGDQDPDRPPRAYRKALKAALPKGTVGVRMQPRRKGGGSLGRPRWVAVREWHGGPVVREAKAIVPSAWNLVGGREPLRLNCEEIATGKYRAPDPWYRLTDSVLVRRLSPSNRKLEFETPADAVRLLTTEILALMGRDLAAIHLGVDDHARAIRRDLAARGDGWLVDATRSAMTCVDADFAVWKGDCPAPARAKRQAVEAAEKR